MGTPNGIYIGDPNLKFSILYNFFGIRFLVHISKFLSKDILGDAPWGCISSRFPSRFPSRFWMVFLEEGAWAGRPVRVLMCCTEVGLWSNVLGLNGGGVVVEWEASFVN